MHRLVKEVLNRLGPGGNNIWKQDIDVFTLGVADAQRNIHRFLVRIKSAFHTSFEWVCVAFQLANFFKRIIRNPTFYGIREWEEKTIKEYLMNLIDENLYELKTLNCIEILEDDYTIQPNFLG